MPVQHGDFEKIRMLPSTELRVRTSGHPRGWSSSCKGVATAVGGMVQVDVDHTAPRVPDRL